MFLPVPRMTAKFIVSQEICYLFPVGRHPFLSGGHPQGVYLQGVQRGEDVPLGAVVVEQGLQLVADFAELVLYGGVGATLLRYRPVLCLAG